MLPWQRHNNKQVSPKLGIFIHFRYCFQFFKQNRSICLILHFISILARFFINFRYFLTFVVNGEIQYCGSKMEALMTSCGVVWRHSQQKSQNLIEQATGFFSIYHLITLCLNRAKTLGGGGPSTPLLYDGGGMILLVCPRVNMMIVITS